MPMQDSYGRILREAREREGYDLTTMARRLHIRPDILRSIEESDFGRMPASGYTRNMIRAYARAVGLDQKRISEMYLDELHLFDTGRPRAGSARADSHSAQRNSRAHRNPAAGRAGRASYNEDTRRTSQSRNLNRNAPSRTSSSRNSSRSIPARSASGRAPSRGYGYVGDERHQASRRGSAMPDPRRRNTLYGGKQASRGLPSFAIWIGIAIVAIVLIIILVVLFNSGRQSVQDVPDIPISGLTDTSNPEGTVSADVVETPPEKAVLKLSVESGKSSWIEVKEGDSKSELLSEVVRGPFEEEYDVTGTLTVRTANPSPVTVEVDGVEQKLTKQSGTEYYVYTLDFQTILDEWNEQHPSADSSSSSASSSASSSSSKKSSE